MSSTEYSSSISVSNVQSVVFLVYLTASVITLPPVEFEGAARELTEIFSRFLPCSCSLMFRVASCYSSEVVTSSDRFEDEAEMRESRVHQGNGNLESRVGRYRRKRESE